MRIQRLGERISVLLVEDERLEREIFRSVLEESGFDVYCAETIDKALTAFTWHWIDVVLVDADVEGGKGLEFTRYLKSLPVYPHDARLPVMVYSRNQESIASEAFEAGADDFLWEPSTNLHSLPELVSKAA